jgi:uncharacterized protein YndB with AHSA1/START domain
MNASTLPAVERSLIVDVPAEWAFKFFTERIGDWWPLEQYSIFSSSGRGRPDEAVFEPRVGGRVFERLGDEEADWGEVLVWEPPRRVVFSWQVNPDWPDATEVEITFTPEGEGTRVALEHRGWERLGGKGPEAREGYANGWIEVLSNYEQGAAAAST